MIPFEKAFEEVAELVRKFDEHKDEFMAHNYLDLTLHNSVHKRLQQKCDYLDGEIDRLMRELYGLTAEEIKIVEGASKVP